MTPVPHCDLHLDCDRRFTELGEWMARIDERQRVQGESIAAVRAQVAAYAAVGSLIGGGLVSLASHLFR
jgi:type II secretory pathway component PulM